MVGHIQLDKTLNNISLLNKKVSVSLMVMVCISRKTHKLRIKQTGYILYNLMFRPQIY
jgi:hypothetical protein